MRKKIKDITILELLASVCRANKCSECPLNNYGDSLSSGLCELANCESSKNPTLDLEVEVLE